MPRSSRHSSTELQATATPLIDLSSSPVPHYRSRSAAQSEDEDDDYDRAARRPLVPDSLQTGQRGWKAIFSHGGLGSFWFGTWLGWQIYVGILVFWVIGCSFGQLLMNRFLMTTGVYKFPYPLAATWIQLLLTHAFLLGFASLTRALTHPLQVLGLGGIIAPGLPAASTLNYRASTTTDSTIQRLLRYLYTGSGGIAGGGMLEFDKQSAKHVAPLALVYVLKVVFSNESFAISPYTVYQLARIGTVPLSLIFTTVLTQETHSESILSASLIATMFLGVASVRTDVRFMWESIVTGILSSIFAALYPIILLRTYRLLVADLVPQGDILTGFPADVEDETSTSRAETRAYWRTLHYTSTLSLLILTPVLLVSGEVGDVLRNCYFLDVPFFWFLATCAGIGSWAVFASTLLLAKATSPLSVTFLSTPRGLFQSLVFSRFRLPPHSWIGVILCIMSSLWFLAVRRNEGRTRSRLRIEGR